MQIPRTPVKNIIIVDDELSILNFMSEVFKLNGYQVTKELSSIEALKRISSNPSQFDVLITDQSMPQMSSVELIECACQIRKDLPAILVTGYDERDFQEKNPHIRMVLSKPFDMNELLQPIHSI